MADRRRTHSVSSYFVIALPLAMTGALAYASTALKSFDLATAALSVFLAMALVRLMGRLSLARLEARLSLDSGKIFRGETVTIKSEIRNAKPVPVRIGLELAHAPALEPGPDGAHGEMMFGPFERNSGVWKFLAVRRGVYTLGPVTLVGSDPFNLYRMGKRLPFEWEVVVFPRIRQVRDPQWPFRDTFGIHPSRGIIEDPAWYEGTREYSGNKPARYIHWKASARFDVLQEKIFAPTSHEKILLLLDGSGFRKAQDQEGLETAIEMAASLSAAFTEAGATIAFATDRSVKDAPACLPLGRGPEHLGAVLEILARMGNDFGSPLDELAKTIEHQGAGFFVIARSFEDIGERLPSLQAAGRNKIAFLFALPGAAEKRTEATAARPVRWATFDDLLAFGTTSGAAGNPESTPAGSGP